MLDMENTVAPWFEELKGEEDDSRFADILWALLENNYKAVMLGDFQHEDLQEIVVLVGNGWTFETAITAVSDKITERECALVTASMDHDDPSDDMPF